MGCVVDVSRVLNEDKTRTRGRGTSRKTTGIPTLHAIKFLITRIHNTIIEKENIVQFNPI